MKTDFENIFNSGLSFPQWFIDAINTCPCEYKKLLSRMDIAKKILLLDFISYISKLGVAGFGYRNFDITGNSVLFPLSKDWNELNKDILFSTSLEEYVVQELLYAVKNQQRIITRSGDKIDNRYLKFLAGSSVNNGVVIYQFNNVKVNVFYIVCADVRVRDFVLNKLEVIENLIGRVMSVLRWIIQTEEMRRETIRCLTKEQINIVFSSSYQSTGNMGDMYVEVKGDKIKISCKEVECLAYLQYGITMKSIADFIGKSPFTIKDRVESLKNKFNVATKKDLVFLARNQLGHILNKFEINIK
ncbi:MAG: helix-turn-helix transcriptional regulator [Rickettsiaceae bacterium]|nr:helix-turn-helix transcriptional regulator [Rickettsiaceae bacterium]